MTAPSPNPSQNPRNSFPPWRFLEGTINAPEDQLEGLSSWCERWEWRCAGLVVLAVVVEIIIAWVHPLYDSPINKWGTTLADAAIALGIVGEVIFGRFDARIQTELRKRSNEQLASAAKSAAEANERAAKANARAVEAQAELEKFRAMRILSPEQHERIVEKLQQFPGQEFSGAIGMGVGDGALLWRHLAGILQRAGWTLVRPPGSTTGDPPHTTPTLTTRGVIIMFSARKVVELLPRAQALAEAIAAEGIDAMWAPAHGAVDSMPNAIRIEIGLKP
jgi:hypothetical protein